MRIKSWGVNYPYLAMRVILQNTLHYDSGTTNDCSLTEPEIGVVLSGFSDQSITAGCYWIVKVHSNYGNFKMLVELVRRGPDDDGDLEARGCPQIAFLVFWDSIPVYLSRDTGTGCMTGTLPPLLFEMVPLRNSIIRKFRDAGERWNGGGISPLLF